MAMTFLAFYNRSWVKLPVPGPIYKTTSVGRIPLLVTISVRIWELIKICWP